MGVFCSTFWGARHDSTVFISLFTALSSLFRAQKNLARGLVLSGGLCKPRGAWLAAAAKRTATACFLGPVGWAQTVPNQSPNIPPCPFHGPASKLSLNRSNRLAFHANQLHPVLPVRNDGRN